MRQLLARAGLERRVGVDSAGMHGYHAGEAPDPRSRETSARHGFPLDGLAARQVRPQDFADYDLLLGMDSGHLAQLQRLAPQSQRHKAVLFLEYAGVAPGGEVPDPYYGGPREFEQAFDLILRGCEGVMARLAQERLGRDGGAC